MSARSVSKTVNYDKDTQVNASEVVAIDYLSHIGVLKDGFHCRTREELTRLFGEALLESDSSLKEFVQRYRVVL